MFTPLVALYVEKPSRPYTYVYIYAYGDKNNELNPSLSHFRGLTLCLYWAHTTLRERGNERRRER
jgi:hypothetical protein